MMGARVLQGNVFDLLPTLRPGSVDCVVTSPPYWKLRSYLPAGHALKPLELGGEPTPAEWVASMVRVLRLVRTAMADHATCWLNVGDTYSTSGGTEPGTANKNNHGRTDKRSGRGLAQGSLCLIPQRLAVALQSDGWLVRSVIVWHKPAAMPASLSGWAWRRCRVKVKPAPRGKRSDTAALGGKPRADHNGHDFASADWSDCPGCAKCAPHGGYRLRRGSWRPTSSWEPVLLLAKQSGYFCDAVAVQQPAAAATAARNDYSRVTDDPDEQYAVSHDHETELTTANPRDVWTIPAEPLRAGLCEGCGHFLPDASAAHRRHGHRRCPKCGAKLGKHYASFPSELVHRCLKAGTSARGYCRACGAPWCRVVEPTPGTAAKQEAARNGQDWYARGWDNTDKFGLTKSAEKDRQGGSEYKTLEWRPTCACPPAEPRPGLVLDPFAGSGRTLAEALRMGLDGVGCELNPEYAAMANRILRDQSPLFAGAGHAAD